MIQAFLQKYPRENFLAKKEAEFEERNKVFREHNLEGFLKAKEKFLNKQKLELNKKIKPDSIKEIIGLDTASKLGKEYIKDMNFALNFALENRKRMIQAVLEAMNEALDANESLEEIEGKFINRNHNHAEFNQTRGEWIHRKGATHAERGMYGVIPGNMRDGSFIVLGRGNSDSLHSSSHGAGRVMSRKKACECISLEEFKKSMGDIVGTIDEGTIDESPFAYKDIFEVMDLQKDLVEVVEHIKPLINVKDMPKRRF
jgi:tRNA-splicing ligase RtcB